MMRALVILVSMMALACGGLLMYNGRPLPCIIIERRDGMDFKDAAEVKVPFGQYRGQSIDDVATTTNGLLWLDWVRGKSDRESKQLAEFYGEAWKPPVFHQALCAYLDDPTIAKDLAEAARLPRNAGR